MDRARGLRRSPRKHVREAARQRAAREAARHRARLAQIRAEAAAAEEVGRRPAEPDEVVENSELEIGVAGGGRWKVASDRSEAESGGDIDIEDDGAWL